MSSINLKPSKPDTYDGTRDFLVVNTWLYKVEQYLSLTQLSSPNVAITYHNRIAFASSYLTGNAAVWWFNLVKSPETFSSWDAFKNVIVKEFIPADHTRRARDKLRKLKQLGPVEKYLAEYRNTVLMIGDNNDGEKLDRFIDGLKYGVKVEVMKSGCSSFEECARIALTVDSAIWGARRTSSGFFPAHSKDKNEPTPMEIGNVNGENSSKAQREQRRRDISQGACFRCHKVGCRPWKCDPSRVKHMNVGASDSVPEGSTVVLSDSENE